MNTEAIIKKMKEEIDYILMLYICKNIDNGDQKKADIYFNFLTKDFLQFKAKKNRDVREWISFQHKLTQLIKKTEGE